MKKILLLGLLALSAFGLERPNIGEMGFMFNQMMKDPSTLLLVCEEQEVGSKRLDTLMKSDVVLVYTKREYFITTMSGDRTYRLHQCIPASVDR